MGRGTLYAVLLDLVGCVGTADYESVARACDEEILTWQPDIPAKELAQTISGRCASILGDAVGMDWDSFGCSADALVEAELCAYVMVGLFAIVASDHGTGEEVVADPWLPEIARDRLLAEAQGLNRSTAEVWFQLTQDAIVTTIYADSLAFSDGSGAGMYSQEDRAVVFSDPLLGHLGLEQAALPAFPAAVWIHEASHAFAPKHVRCASGNANGCDPTPEGACGIEVWWLNDWMIEYDVLSSPACVPLDDLKRGVCTSKIEDTEGWEPCERICW